MPYNKNLLFKEKAANSISEYTALSLDLRRFPTLELPIQVQRVTPYRDFSALTSSPSDFYLFFYDIIISFPEKNVNVKLP